MKTFRRDLLVAFFAITAFLSIIPVITYAYFAADLSPKERLVNHNDTGIELLDRNDKTFFTFYQAKTGKEVPLSGIPLYTRQAIIAAEDKDFYLHPGFSPKAILRALFSNAEEENLSYGASTITQQLVKNSLLHPRKDFLRKYQEIVLSSEVERRYSKEEILEMYLNTVYFGEGAFGVEEAARVYFNKPAQELTLAESAALAAILPAPSRYSLFNNLGEAKSRQRLVLDSMVKQKYITQEEKDQALNEDLQTVRHVSDINNIAPHFALMVRDELIRQYGEDVVVRSGFKVKTTIDVEWQKFAQGSVAKQVENLKGNRVTNGAAVVLDPKTSEIRVLVGSKDWYDDKFGKVNIALSPRPPGSSFKPVVYIKAFEKNILTPATILQDQPTSFANFDENKYYASFPSRAAAQAALASDPNAFYRPVNYDRKFRGPVTVRRALANSLNVPAVAVMKKIGVDEAIFSAQNLGITTLKDPSNYGLALVLGAGEVKLLELTNVYAVFASGGYKNTPVSILEVRDRTGALISQYQPNPQRVVEEKYAFLISSILSDNKTRAEVFGTALNISRPAAVKTGTTEDFKDAWTIGYTPSLVVGVWVGNNYNEPMDGIAGSLGAAPIWKDLMERFSSGAPVEQFEPPEGVVKLAPCTIDKAQVATASAGVEYFVKGTEPLKPCLNPTATPSAAISPRPRPSSAATPAPTSTPSPTVVPTSSSSPN
ncbi:PBP1A family penicillin-binding protein [Candidatus Daviesbacteria bacterium]|nr:PBP1A family penicillin-binding protein [Candidatus Daviesbacteria bacterium]